MVKIGEEEGDPCLNFYQPMPICFSSSLISLSYDWAPQNQNQKEKEKEDSVNMLNPYIQKCHSVGINIGLSIHTHPRSQFDNFFFFFFWCCLCWNLEKSKRSAMWLMGKNENYKFCWYSIHIMSRIIPSLFLSFILLPRTILCLSLLHPILCFFTHIVFVLHLFSSTSLTKSKVTTKSV